jgi:hypothetical protein
MGACIGVAGLSNKCTDYAEDLPDVRHDVVRLGVETRKTRVVFGPWARTNVNVM